MSYGFDLGRLRSDSIGMSFVDRFVHSGGTTVKAYTSEAYAYATRVEVVMTPGVDIPASTVPVFPTISKQVSRSARTLSVTASGGNITLTLLIFVG